MFIKYFLSGLNQIFEKYNLIKPPNNTLEYILLLSWFYPKGNSVTRR